MGVVINMHETRAARANGAAIAVAITARRLGLTDAQVIACAKAVDARVRAGLASAAGAHADAKAAMRAKLPGLQA